MQFKQIDNLPVISPPMSLHTYCMRQQSNLLFNFINNLHNIHLLMWRYHYHHQQQQQPVCKDNSNVYNNNTSAGPCEATHDRILCWPETPANTLMERDCPGWYYGFVETGKATRLCRSDGTWNTLLKKQPDGSFAEGTYTNYHACVSHLSKQLEVLAVHEPKLKMILRIGASLSLVLLTVAIVVLCVLKNLHCARNFLHGSLFLVFFIFSLMYLIKEIFFVKGLGLEKDVIRDDKDKYSMNPNVSVRKSHILSFLQAYFLFYFVVV